MMHLAHVVLFAAILSVYFAFLSGKPGRRLRFGLLLFACFAGGGLLAGLLMYPFA